MTPLLTSFPLQWGALLGVIAHWGLHIGFGATMHLGMFIPVSIAAHVIKTPPMFWDWLTAKVSLAGFFFFFFFSLCWLLASTLRRMAAA